MISINNVTFSTKAAIGTVVGTFSLLNTSMASIPAHYMLTQGCAGFFNLSGGALVTTSVVPPALYSVRVSAVGTTMRWKETAHFVITVTAT
jgi:hypothetical protein